MDVSELKAVQEQLREAKEEAEAAAHAKATFLATMSHEIRTPMNGVVGMIDILSQTKMEGDQKDMLATVRGSAFSLLGIIDDILDFSKMEAGKLQVEFLPVSIRDIVGNVTETLMVKAAEKGLDLISFVDPEIPALVLGDQVRLRQILFNLGGNALKFTEQGRVIIRADGVAAPAAGQVAVCYSVSDQGIGMSEEGLKKLFQPFSQAESSTTRRFGGTGLGLSICKTLTEMMGGEIDVESEPGVGSTFTATVPHEIVDAQAQAEIKTDLKDVNVLMLMRDRDRRAFVRRYLEHWQATVQETEEVGAVPELALAAAASGRPFDVLVQGLAWSEREHAELRKSLHGDPQLSNIRFVVLRRDRSRADRAEIVDAVTVEGTPLRRESVLTAVAVAAGRASPEVRYEEEIADLSRGEAPSIEEAEALGELILVAEDDPTNQNVIRRQLGALGYAAEVVADGEQALRSLEKRNYAILLTDCHMPVMDGFRLAQTVRSTENAAGEHLPIVAITASVLKGDLDRCLDAGMDDYLPKPVEMVKLKQMLAKWMPATADASADVPSAPLADNPQRNTASDEDQAPIDLTFLRDCFGDDDATHREILKDFVDSTPSYIQSIHTALNQKSATEVASLAHAFKSAARTVGARELADLCQNLEYAGKAERWDRIETLAPRLDPAMESVTHFVASF
ncbi:MAG: ATP-binding protein [Gammaproteobacteria bacterium]